MNEKNKTEKKEPATKASAASRTPPSGKAGAKRKTPPPSAKPDKEPEKPLIATNTEERSGASRLFWVLVLFAVLAGGGYATLPIWSPYVIDYLPGLQTAGQRQQEQIALTSRLEQIEQEIERVRESGEGIADLERQRQSLSGSIDRIMTRIGELEGQISDVRAMLEATEATGGGVSDPEALMGLKERMSRLERSDDTVGVVLQRLARLEQAVADGGSGEREATEQLSRAVSDMTARVGTLESEAAQTAARDAAAVAEAERKIRVQGLLVALGQLRETIRSSEPYVLALDALKTLGRDDQDILGHVAVLAPHSETGIPGLDELRRDFKTVVEMIRAARPQGGADGEGGVVDKVLVRLQSLVSIRKTGNAEPGGGDAGAAERAMTLLDKGELAAAVVSLSGLGGQEAQAANPWIERARARLQAEEALARLHGLVISKLSPGGRQ